MSGDATRHNAVALGLDYGLFLIGLSFASQATVLPAFAAHLGAPNVVIGAIPAVMTGGWLLPALFAAGHAEALPRKLPFVLRWTVWERVPFVLLALVAFVVAERAAPLALALLLTMLLVITGVGGVLMPAWMDIVGRAIPTTRRGRFFAAASVLAAVGGFLGSFVTTWVLAWVPAPHGYGVCFLLAAVFMGLSYVALTAVREPPGQPAAAATPLGAYLGRVPALLRRDRNLAWFLTARACAALGLMATAFYTAYALEAYRAPAWRVGVFTALLFAGQITGNVALGWLADRAGHRLVIATGVACTTAGSVLAVVAPTLEVFSAVFPLLGVHQAAINVSSQTIALEFAPTVAEQPTYVGLSSTLTAPVAVGAPLLAGALADGLGFGPVFLVAALFGAVALALLLGCVRDPRHVRAAPARP